MSMTVIDYGFIDEVLEKHEYSKSETIGIMQDIQGKYRYLPEEALRYAAKKIGVSPATLYGVATFYENCQPGDTMSSDGLFTIERVACLGACGLAPVCTVNGVVHATMTPEKIRKLVKELREAEKV